jgi:hypothetical protein
MEGLPSYYEVKHMKIDRNDPHCPLIVTDDSLKLNRVAHEACQTILDGTDNPAEGIELLASFIGSVAMSFPDLHWGAIVEVQNALSDSKHGEHYKEVHDLIKALDALREVGMNQFQKAIDLGLVDKNGKLCE